MSCYCDNCYYSIKPCLNQVVETLEHTCDEAVAKTCSGFTTALVIHECSAEVDDDETLCSRCEVMREIQEDLEDEAVERVYQRELQNEERNLMGQYGDLDGDDGDAEVNALQLQLVEDNKKRPFLR